MMNKTTSTHKSSQMEHTAKQKLHHNPHSAKEPAFSDEEIELSASDGDVEVEMEEFAAHRTSAGCGCGCGAHNAHY
ncbi:MAG: hypothetical protein IJ545_05685 [Alphaproteobacteria bacterium]|nr:hypothetical protein [Alphaproteobacteria bacterium]